MSLGTTVSETFGASSNDYVGGLSSYWRWDTTADGGGPNIVRTTFDAGGWTAGQMNAVNIAIGRWSIYSNLSFGEPVGGTQADREAEVEILLHLTVGANIGGFGGYSGTPGEALSTTVQNVNGDNVLVADQGRVHTYIASDAFLNGRACFDGSGNLTAAGFELVMHEVGHALGLKHPHDFGAVTNAAVFPGVTPGNTADLGDNSLNQQLYTIMSYNQEQFFGGGDCATPMAFDVAAIQHAYGARADVNGGDNNYFLSDPNDATTWSCIWDTGGIDQIVYVGFANAVIDLRPATLDNSSTGGGVTSYTTNGSAFGRGYTIAGDVTGAIADRNGVTGVIIENARGSGGNDVLIGNDVANVLNTDDGLDLLVGNGGNDTLIGGNGADTLYGDGGRDTADYTYFGVSGIGVDVHLADSGLNGRGAAGDVLIGVENLLGTSVADGLFGDASANALLGFDGDDVLAGLGGGDTLLGGLGRDTFEIGAGEVGGDIINGGAGFDRVLALGTTGLANATVTSIEEIEFFFPGTAPISVNIAADQVGAGFAANLVVDGNLNNVADTLRIVMGADTNLNLTAFTFETWDSGGAENDRVIVLGDNDAETIAGSSQRDDINGGGGTDQLFGGGGIDVLRGGLGNDLYTVNAQGEAVEFAGEGVDTVRSNVDYALGAHIERLQLIGGAAIDGTGNTGDNVVTGNGNANRLNGSGGDDVLTGGAGADRFTFTTALGAGNVDTVTDFLVGVDKIVLDNAVFAGLPVGPLAANRFATGAAGDPLDRIVYDAATGGLFYDPDGNPAGPGFGAPAIRFATLDAGLALSASDFVVI